MSIPPYNYHRRSEFTEKFSHCRKILSPHLACATFNKIELRPPYVITKEQIDQMVSVLEIILK